MNLKHVLSAGLALFVIGLVAPTAQAVPVVGPAGTADSEVAGGLVEKVHGRYRHRSYRPYYYDSYRPYDNDSYDYDPYYYRSYRRYYHTRYYNYDYYPIPPYRNERWWFNGNSE